jgi:hypothetical protein
VKRIEAARRLAFKGLRQKEYAEAHFAIYYCDACGEDTVIPDKEAASGYKCAMCGDEESQAVEVNCGICGAEWAKCQMWRTDWADDGVIVNVCPRCRHDPEYVKVD